ncbi:MerR family transcriptional regulator [Streptomyces scopuliridis]|uniref:MerR family transcriptional regulator n=1 Tax=Streptomyces scopuliridis TaxID=452529 RepID=UPI002DD94BB1|nr:MerR family transcriptional regulator [Streptomyces scopuliridis]WSB32655.1 MerR family transcriptional regulator [Streptomyces scopuliridis]
MDLTTNSTAHLLGISAFARRVGLAPSALRFYDDCGVLRPARVDATTGYRFYRPDQDIRARLLRSLRAAGLPLAEVTVVLDGDEDEARAVLERHRNTVRDRTRTADATIEAVLRSLSGEGDGTRTDSGAGAGAGAETEAVTLVHLGGVELASAFRQVVPAVGHDPEHPELGCVLVEIDDGEVRLVATDRYRLSMRVLRPVAAVEGPARRLLLAANSLPGTGAWAARCAAVTIEAGPDGATLHETAGAASRELPVSTAEFPAYREMLSALTPARHRLIVNRTALLDAVNGCGETPAVVLRLGEDEVTVSLPDHSRATALPAVCPGEQPPRIGFDPAVLAPALEASVGPDVLLEIATVTEPVVVRSADQGSFTTLVMPVSLDRAAV